MRAIAKPRLGEGHVWLRGLRAEDVPIPTVQHPEDVGTVGA